MGVDGARAARDGLRRMLADLSVVRVSCAVRTDDGTVLVPAGTVGTVVGVHPRTSTYVVEFPDPVPCVATVPADDVVPA